MPELLWRGKLFGVIGGGNMAEALVRGVLESGLMPSSRVVVYDPLPARRDAFSRLGCLAVENAGEAFQADAILLAVKPQQLREAISDMGTAMRKDALVISIAAGIGTGTIEKSLQPGARVVRVMPNTPLLVGQGMSALARGAYAGTDDMRMALALFSCAGTAVEVDESDLDAVTALSGSGPAYLFRFAEALIAGGMQMGLDHGLSRELTINMLRGSAEMLARFRDPASLREQVTSPGGTTAAALRVFEERGLFPTVVDALAAARVRSIELGRQK